MCGDKWPPRPARSAAPRRMLHALCRESRPPRWLRKMAGVPSLGGQRGASPDEVCRERGRGVGPQRHEAFLAALAAQPHDPPASPHRRCPAPWPRRSGRRCRRAPQQGSVTKRGGVSPTAAASSRRSTSVTLMALGSRPGGRGGLTAADGSAGTLAFEREESVQSAHRDDRTGCRCRRQSGRAVAALAQGQEEGRDVLLPHRRGSAIPSAVR